MGDGGSVEAEMLPTAQENFSLGAVNFACSYPSISITYNWQIFVKFLFFSLITSQIHSQGLSSYCPLGVVRWGTLGTRLITSDNLSLFFSPSFNSYTHLEIFKITVDLPQFTVNLWWRGNRTGKRVPKCKNLVSSHTPLNSFTTGELSCPCDVTVLGSNTANFDSIFAAKWSWKDLLTETIKLWFPPPPPSLSYKCIVLRPWKF